MLRVIFTWIAIVDPFLFVEVWNDDGDKGRMEGEDGGCLRCPVFSKNTRNNGMK